MVPRIKISLPAFLALFIYLSSGIIKDFTNCKTSVYLIREDVFGITSRKLLSHDEVLDYDDPGANPKHDPGGKRGGEVVARISKAPFVFLFESQVIKS